jgi:hypothetical protein
MFYLPEGNFHVYEHHHCSSIASWSNLATKGELPLGPSALIIEDDDICLL